MDRLRRWSVGHAGLMARIYGTFERCLLAVDPLLARVGYDRLERPMAAIERGVKGSLFDCRMCGQCILGSTGASCPMNCPKNLRNGPCGGVRPDGRCEVVPDMACVWVLAFEGSQRMPEGDRIRDVQPPLDHRLWGRSAWLGLLRGRRAGRAKEEAGAPAAATSPPAPLRRAA